MKEVITINFIIAQVFGIIALIVLIISFQKNTTKKLLKLQVMSSLLYALQYLFLNAYTGLYMNIACAFRNILFYKEKKSLIKLIIIIVLMIILGILSYSNIYSLLPMIAVIIYSIALWYGNLKIIRIVEVISCSLYIIYNIKVLAITGFIATIIELIGAIVAIIKSKNKE